MIFLCLVSARHIEEPKPQIFDLASNYAQNHAFQLQFSPGSHFDHFVGGLIEFRQERRKFTVD